MGRLCWLDDGDSNRGGGGAGEEEEGEDALPSGARRAGKQMTELKTNISCRAAQGPPHSLLEKTHFSFLPYFLTSNPLGHAFFYAHPRRFQIQTKA